MKSVGSGIEQRLLDGETILWRGRPAQGLLIVSTDAMRVPFSILWAGFAIFWESSVLRQPHAPIFMKLWGLPFVLIGLYLVLGRFVLDAYVRRNTEYAVTTQRVLVNRRRAFASFTTLAIDKLPELILNEKENGTGTIRFGMPVQGRQPGNNFSWTPSLDPSPQFIRIADVRAVFDLIQSTGRSV